MRRLALAAIIALLAAGPAGAQTLREFCADRPGKATPPCILDAGHAQLEVGLADAAFQRARGVHEDVYTLGAGELRLGMTSRLEAEAAWAPLIVDHLRGAEERTGGGDLTLGLRGALTPPDAEGPAVSLQGFVTAPTATHGLGAGGWTGGLRLPASIPLGGNVALGLAPEMDVLRDGQGGGVHVAWAAAAGLSRAFDKTTLGLEAWGAIGDGPSHVSRQASADLTAALAVGADAQLDAGVNLGLTRATPGLELYVGIARRF